MVEIKTLAPTILDALKAVALGCRNVQNDPYFTPEMSQWMIISKGVCYGCLATCTILQLVNKSPKDIVDSFISDPLDTYKSTVERAVAYGLQPGTENVITADFPCFELAINSLRTCDVWPLLKFYGLNDHENATEAAEWLLDNQTVILDSYATQDDLIAYSDFLNTVAIPKLQTLLLLN
jgi:hypothetical protein